MDRGFGSTFRSGRGGFTGNNNRDRVRDERRYDDFYSDNRRAGNIAGTGNNNRHLTNTNDVINRGGSWGNSATRDRGFFNQQGNRQRGGAAASGGSNVSGQMLAALQQQQNLLTAFMNTQHQPHNPNRHQGMLPNGNKFGHGNKFNNNRDYKGGNNKTGDKRRHDATPSGILKRNRRSGQGLPSGIVPGKSTSGSKVEKKLEIVPKPQKPKVEEEPDIPDEDVVIPDSLMDSVEKLRQRSDIERNVADEDVKKLVVFLFTGKGYQCLTCGLLFSKEEGFIHHLMGKSHVMNVIDARSAKKYQTMREILDIDLSPDDWFEKNEQAKAILLKQSKLFMKARQEIEKREKENYEKTPSNFFTVQMESKKCARKQGETVTITSIVESTIEIKDFSKDRFFGCEFVKAVTGFQCRLCNIQIKEASAVIPHVSSKVHRNNYQMHLNKNRGYEKLQKEQNKELLEVLGENEDAQVLLHETTNANDGVFLKQLDSDIVRDKKLLEPPSEKNSESVDKKDTVKEVGDESSSERKSESANVIVLSDELDHEDSKVDDKENKEVKEEEEEISADSNIEEENDQIEHVKEAENDNEDSKGDSGETNDETEEEETKSFPEEEEEQKQEEEAKEETPSTDANEEEQKGKAPRKTTVSARGKGTKRGRGRGSKVTPSPRSRRAAAVAANKAVKEEASDIVEDESYDASFMDSFQVVDEVDEE